MSAASVLVKAVQGTADKERLVIRGAAPAPPSVEPAGDERRAASSGRLAEPFSEVFTAAVKRSSGGKGERTARETRPAATAGKKGPPRESADARAPRGARAAKRAGGPAERRRAEGTEIGRLAGEDRAAREVASGEPAKDPEAGAKGMDREGTGPVGGERPGDEDRIDGPGNRRDPGAGARPGARKAAAEDTVPGTDGAPEASGAPSEDGPPALSPSPVEPSAVDPSADPLAIPDAGLGLTSAAPAGTSADGSPEAAAPEDLTADPAETRSAAEAEAAGPKEEAPIDPEADPAASAEKAAPAGAEGAPEEGHLVPRDAGDEPAPAEGPGPLPGARTRASSARREATASPAAAGKSPGGTSPANLLAALGNGTAFHVREDIPRALDGMGEAREMARPPSPSGPSGGGAPAGTALAQEAKPAASGGPAAAPAGPTFLDLTEGRDRWAAKMALAIRSQIRSGGGQLRMVLKPPLLGQVEMKLALRGPAVRLSIDVESNSARHILSAGVAELRENLKEAGLSLEKMRITVNERERRSGQGDDRPDQGSGGRRRPGGSAADEAAAAAGAPAAEGSPAAPGINFQA